MSTLDRLIPWVKEHAPAGAEVTAESRLRDDLGMDSLDRYDLACDILDEFKVDLADDKMTAAETVSDVVKLIDEALAAMPVRGMA